MAIHRIGNYKNYLQVTYKKKIQIQITRLVSELWLSIIYNSWICAFCWPFWPLLRPQLLKRNFVNWELSLATASFMVCVAYFVIIRTLESWDCNFFRVLLSAGSPIGRLGYFGYDDSFELFDDSFEIFDDSFERYRAYLGKWSEKRRPPPPTSSAFNEWVCRKP